jgi:MOSC domain-containing protein YiiM
MGRLAGIARHARPGGVIEEIAVACVTAAEGVEGNCRGTPVSGKQPRRQVTLIEAESWALAMTELGLEGATRLPWSQRRANLLVEGLRLPREPGKVISIGKSLRIETTMECDPCRRMEAVHPGLMQALTPDWRGGVCGRVIADGDIEVGDEVRIEP